MSKIYFNQADSRWANFPYTSPAHPSATIKTSGCGPTSGAMVVSSLVGTMLPDAMSQLFKNNGFRANEGTDLRAFKWLSDYYKLNYKETNNIDDAVNCLHRGGMVICSCTAGGLFSTGGHIIALAGMKDPNTIIVYDPYLYSGKFNINGRKGKVTVSGNNIYCTMNNFNNYAKCQKYFCYEKKQEVKKPDLRYKAHVQDLGWQDWKDSGKEAGTDGKAKRIEAVIFEGNNGLNIEYRAHIQDIGWTDWKKSGEIAGTTGQSKRLEAIEIKCNKTLEVQEHVQNEGWTSKYKSKEFILGTVGKALRLEAFKINVM